METSKKKLTLKKEQIAGFDEMNNVKGGADSVVVCRPTDRGTCLHCATGGCPPPAQPLTDPAKCIMVPELTNQIWCPRETVAVCILETDWRECLAEKEHMQ